MNKNTRQSIQNFDKSQNIRQDVIDTTKQNKLDNAAFTDNKEKQPSKFYCLGQFKHI